MNPKPIGPFTLMQKIGVGGMGTVYRAVYTKTGREVALKVLSPELSSDPKLIARFEREVNILKKLQHPHVVKYFGCGREGKQRFLIMELVAGGSLESVLKERSRFSWELSVEYGLQICEALGYLHEQGIVHRDLKPANLLLGEDGKLKLSDFGIARDAQATALTAAGRTVGTFAYMAPEQIRGKPAVSPKTDLYALGCVLFEFLTGRPPFDADSEANLLFKHLKDDPPRVMSLAIDCPVWLESVVTRLLEKDPAKRPYDAASVQSSLTEVHEKVAGNAGIASHAATGGASTLTVDHDAYELIRLLKRDKKRGKKKKKSQQLPVYEQTWFLIVCLLLVIGGVAWALQPLSEDKLFAEAETLMQSEEPYKWREAQEKYLAPLLERFPETKYASQAREFIDRIDVHSAETRAKTRMLTQREPESVAEQLFIDAYRLEQFGDRVSAHQKFLSMAELLKDRPKDRAFLLLARQHIAAIEAEGSLTGGQVDFVVDNLKRAEVLFQQGKVVNARGIWNSIVSLYAGNSELEPLVKRSHRLSGQEVEPLPELDERPVGDETTS